MACPRNELSEHCTGDMDDVDGKIRLHSEFPYAPLKENKFDFPALGTLIAFFLAGFFSGGFVVALLGFLRVIP